MKYSQALFMCYVFNPLFKNGPLLFSIVPMNNRQRRGPSPIPPIIQLVTIDAMPNKNGSLLNSFLKRYM